MTEAKQKAIELVSSYKLYVNPFIGSSMLTNTTDDQTILFNCKNCAQVAVREILNSEPHDPLFYKQVQKEIMQVSVDDIFKK